MEYLTLNELNLLRKNEQIAHPISRLAFLFSCFTGMQPAQIEQVQFDNIHHSGAGLMVVSGDMRVPMGRMAREVFNEISGLYAELPASMQDGRLFGSLDAETMENEIREWVIQSGIQKDINLSAGRPTFCILALQAGVAVEELAAWCGTTAQDVSQYNALAKKAAADCDIEAFDALFASYFCKEIC